MNIRFYTLNQKVVRNGTTKSFKWVYREDAKIAKGRKGGLMRK